MRILSILRRKRWRSKPKAQEKNRSIANRADNDELVWINVIAKDEIFEILPQKSMILIKV